MAATVYEKEIYSANILCFSGPPTDPKIGKRPWCHFTDSSYKPIMARAHILEHN